MMGTIGDILNVLITLDVMKVYVVANYVFNK